MIKWRGWLYTEWKVKGSERGYIKAQLDGKGEDWNRKWGREIGSGVTKREGMHQDISVIRLKSKLHHLPYETFGILPFYQQPSNNGALLPRDFCCQKYLQGYKEKLSHSS